MRRFMVLFAGLLIIVSFVTALFYVVSDMKSARPAVVHLKASVAGDGDRDGQVTTTEKYVSVTTSQHGTEIFTWDQVLYISEKDSSRTL